MHRRIFLTWRRRPNRPRCCRIRWHSKLERRAWNKWASSAFRPLYQPTRVSVLVLMREAFLPLPRPLPLLFLFRVVNKNLFPPMLSHIFRPSQRLTSFNVLPHSAKDCHFAVMFEGQNNVLRISSCNILSATCKKFFQRGRLQQVSKPRRRRLSNTGLTSRSTIDLYVCVKSLLDRHARRHYPHVVLRAS